MVYRPFTDGAWRTDRSQVLLTPSSFPGFQPLYCSEELQVSKNSRRAGGAASLSWPLSQYSPICWGCVSERLSQRPSVLIIPQLSDPLPWEFLMNLLNCGMVHLISEQHRAYCPENLKRTHSVPPDSVSIRITVGWKNKGFEIGRLCFQCFLMNIKILHSHTGLQVHWTLSNLSF